MREEGQREKRGREMGRGGQNEKTIEVHEFEANYKALFV